MKTAWLLGTLAALGLGIAPVSVSAHEGSSPSRYTPGAAARSPHAGSYSRPDARHDYGRSGYDRSDRYDASDRYGRNDSYRREEPCEPDGRSGRYENSGRYDSSDRYGRDYRGGAGWGQGRGSVSRELELAHEQAHRRGFRSEAEHNRWHAQMGRSHEAFQGSRSNSAGSYGRGYTAPSRGSRWNSREYR